MAHPVQSFAPSSQTDLATDQTTTSASLATLLSVSITLSEPGSIVIHASISVSALLALTPSFALGVDGVLKRQIAGSLGIGASANFTLHWQASLSAGSHTITLQWATSGSTLRCRAATVSATEHAGLYTSQVG